MFYQAYAKNVRVPSKPPPPYIKLWRQLTPLCHVLRSKRSYYSLDMAESQNVLNPVLAKHES